MTVLEGLAGLRSVPKNAILSIGNFDGLHRGHQRILQVASEYRRGTPAPQVVVTFEPHPLTVLKPDRVPPRLTPYPLKLRLLEQAGVDHLVVLPPSPEVLDLSAEDFWAILRDEVKPTHMVEGGSFNFGKNRGGTIDKLRVWAAQSNVTLHVIDAIEAVLLDLTVVPVSSSLVRWLLANGRARGAAICLGRPYILQGPVVKGFQRGRTIGVPTANLDCTGQMTPLEGVYAGRCEISGHVYPAAVSIGKMPTFGENLKQQIEAHLIGFTGDLYGQSIQVELVDWVREQLKFNSLDALKSQLARDMQTVLTRVELKPELQIAAAT